MERAFGIDVLIPAACAALGVLELVGALVYFNMRERGWREFEQRQRMQGQFPARDPSETARLATLKKLMLLSGCATIGAGIILGIAFQTI